LLSELSKTVAKSIRQQGGHLVFPAPQDAENEASAVANIILAELPAEISPEKVADQAKAEAHRHWERLSQQAREKAGHLIREDVWKEQNRPEDIVEFYAAWVPLGSGYAIARRRLMRLLGGRKNARDFLPAQGRAGLPKSSLDGRRETVLQKNVKNSRKLRLAEGEQLDVVGVVKRCAGENRPYPSVARIAADPWLRGVAGSASENREIREAFEMLKKACQATDGIHRLDASAFPQFGAFPFEGTAVYETRYRELANETETNEEVFAPLRQALHRLTKGKTSGGLGLGDPQPYLAMLVADGDRMGAVISQLASADRNRALSAKLAEFGRRAGGRIAEHNGVCVYAGGDDVLALCPVDRALDCARLLHDDFARFLRDFKDGSGRSPTLSVGIAIGHFMEPLEDLLDHGRRAERMAKEATAGAKGDPFGERHGLALLVCPRSGVNFGVREQWQDGDSSLDRRLAHWSRLFTDRALPNKLPYELRLLADQLRNWPDPQAAATSASAPADAVQAEAFLLLKRKQVKKEMRQQLADKVAALSSSADLARLAGEMLVAQWIANAQQQAHRKLLKEAQA